MKVKLAGVVPYWCPRWLIIAVLGNDAGLGRNVCASLLQSEVDNTVLNQSCRLGPLRMGDVEASFLSYSIIMRSIAGDWS
jgi:hypothetical protein